MFSASQLGAGPVNEPTPAAGGKLTVCELSKLNSGAADVFANGRGHLRKLSLGSTFGMAVE